MIEGLKLADIGRRNDTHSVYKETLMINELRIIDAIVY